MNSDDKTNDSSIYKYGNIPEYSATQFGELLTDRMRSRSLRQAEVALVAGVSQNQVCKVMKGYFKSVTPTVQAVSQALDVEPPTQFNNSRPLTAPRHGPVLEEELSLLLDGTPETEDRLVRVLQAIRLLRYRRTVNGAN